MGSQLPPLQAQGSQRLKAPSAGAERLNPTEQRSQNCPSYPGGQLQVWTQGAGTPPPRWADTSCTLSR